MRLQPQFPDGVGVGVHPCVVQIVGVERAGRAGMGAQSIDEWDAIIGQQPRVLGDLIQQRAEPRLGGDQRAGLGGMVDSLDAAKLAARDHQRAEN